MVISTEVIFTGVCEPIRTYTFLRTHPFLADFDLYGSHGHSYIVFQFEKMCTTYLIFIIPIWQLFTQRTLGIALFFHVLGYGTK